MALSSTVYGGNGDAVSLLFWLDNLSWSKWSNDDITVFGSWLLLLLSLSSSWSEYNAVKEAQLSFLVGGVVVVLASWRLDNGDDDSETIMDRGGSVVVLLVLVVVL